MPVCFSDVVLADVFTSFAKVIGDVWLSICMIGPGGSLLIFPHQSGWTRLMVPILMRCVKAIPYPKLQLFILHQYSLRGPVSTMYH